MSYSNHFRILTIALLVMVTSVFAAKNTSGKVRSVIGDVTTQKKSEGNWVPLRVGAKVKEKDIIRTMVESQAVVALPDGSVISVEENSLVEFSQLLSEDGVQTTMTDVKSGKVRFDVQKQASKESSFKFKTGTATAAIRGTDGVFGKSSNGAVVASLRNGRLEIVLSGKIVDIGAGQTVYADDTNFVVLELASSGDLNFLNEIDAMLSDTSMTSDKLKEAILAKDNEYKVKQSAARDSLKCTFKALPDTIYTPTITISGTCPAGVSVEVSGERIESTGEEIQFNPNWAPSAFGDKKFPVVCYAGKISYGCADLKTNYAQQPDTTAKDSTLSQMIPFNVTTPSPLVICDKGVAVIEGEFDPRDTTATLFVKLGSYTSQNLVTSAVKGKWTHSISISDEKGNWDEKYATVEFNGVSGKITAKVDLVIDKSCSSVNQKSPVILFQSSDSIRCEARVYLTGVDKDIVILSTERDNTPLKETYFDKNSYSTTKLKSGFHDYTWIARDQGGNRSEVRKKLGCYPKNVTAEIDIQKGTKERLRVPPPPKGASRVFNREIAFSIKGLPEQDPSHIKRITVKKGNEILLNEENAINELAYTTHVKLEYGKTTTVDIQVILKNGKQINAKKIYEVR